MVLASKNHSLTQMTIKADMSFNLLARNIRTCFVVVSEQKKTVFMGNKNDKKRTIKNRQQTEVLREQRWEGLVDLFVIALPVSPVTSRDSLIICALLGAARRRKCYQLVFFKFPQDSKYLYHVLLRKLYSYLFILIIDESIARNYTVTDTKASTHPQALFCSLI